MSTIDCPKCGHEHEPAGTHEEDSADMECESCGFEFEVEIEYTPDYSTQCKTHEWGEEKTHHSGTKYRSCAYCIAVHLVESEPNQ